MIMTIMMRIMTIVRRIMHSESESLSMGREKIPPLGSGGLSPPALGPGVNSS